MSHHRQLVAVTFATVLAFRVPTPIHAQQVSAGSVTPSPAVAMRASPTMASAVRAPSAPVLDGRADDPAWREAQVIDQFLEYEPNEGATPRFKTELRVMYDEKYLYVLGRMYDPAPDSIVALLSRRDIRTNSEQLKLVIDSYHDKRTAYQFITNPVGVKRDFYVSNDGNEDGSWDAVWDVATRIDSLGWVAEFRIPFSQLRFNNAPTHTFGLLVVRDVARTAQRISWPLYKRNVQGYVSQGGELSGFVGLKSPRRLEVVPYAVTTNKTQYEGNSKFAHPSAVTGGVDMKIGLSSNLTLDATVNPDFGQVEADPAVLNLGAFETFFSERRPFFLEGAGIFTFNTNCGDIDSGCTGLFYSRRIGRSPGLRGAYNDSLDRNPSQTTILGAGKLTGRLGSGFSIGLLDAVTQREVGTMDPASGDLRTIEPRSNFAVLRGSQEIGKGQGDVGVMLTAVNRDLDEWTETSLRRSAYTGGVDLRRRFWSKNYEVRAYLAGSLVQGSEASIAATQRDGVHRYQRPDDDLTYDASRTSLAGNAQRISFSKFGGGKTRFQTVYQRYSAGFETNDLGFQSRADQQVFRNWFSLNYQKPALFYNRAFLNFNTYNAWSAAGLPTSVGLNVNQHVQLKSLYWLHFGVNWNDMITTYDDRVARGGPAVRNAQNVNFWGGFEGDQRKRVIPFLWFGGDRGDEGRSHSYYLEPFFDFRAASNFSSSLGVSFSHSINAAQWNGNFTNAGVTSYTFAHLDQKTVGVTARANYTMTPTLSLQVYANPFVSAGAYSDWKELENPRGATFEDRFRPYTAGADPGGFEFAQFRSNTVLRWEYRPGSTLFVVWQQGREGFDPVPTRFNFSRDYGDLFDRAPMNTLLIKASYWFNP
jgi:hypothetical protein